MSNLIRKKLCFSENKKSIVWVSHITFVCKRNPKKAVCLSPPCMPNIKIKIISDTKIFRTIKILFYTFGIWLFLMLNVFIHCIFFIQIPFENTNLDCCQRSTETMASCLFTKHKKINNQTWCQNFCWHQNKLAFSKTIWVQKYVRKRSSHLA